MAKRRASTSTSKPGAAGRKGGNSKPETASYKHPEATSLLRPEVGTQSQFRKKKPPATYRYDSSLSPVLEWDGQNAGARDAAERELSVVRGQLSAVSQTLAKTRARLEALAEAAAKAGNADLAAAIRALLAENWQLTTDNCREAGEAAERLQRLSRPFLNWAGKAERLSFDVPTLPLFVHERLSTKAILETLKGHRRDKQMTMFDLFGDPQHPVADQVLKAYEFPDKWQNRLILGDSLVVMNSLLRYEGLGGQVQMIYMDPPYGIKYGSNFQPFVRKRDVKHNDDEDMTREPEMVKAYRDTWELGLHSYLSYMRDRLLMARELLHPSGTVFVQISDTNVHHVREIMDEVFGAANQVATITFQKTGSTDEALVPNTVDYLLMYARDIERVKYRQLYQDRKRGSLALERYDYVLESTGEIRRLTQEEATTGELQTKGARVQFTSLTSARPLGAGDLREFELRGKRYTPGTGTFKTDLGGLNRLVEAGRVYATGKSLRYIRRVDDFPVVPISDRWESVQMGTGLFYVVQTSVEVVRRCMLMTTDPGDLVLDPTCGSGTTAYVAEQWGRRWITCDTSRVPLALARQRLLTATYDYYELKDEARGPAGGFVYKRKQNNKGEEVGGIVPHVTLKSIANNEPPDEEVLVDRPEKAGGNITRVTGPFVVEATIPTATPWEELSVVSGEEELSVVSGQLSETENRQLIADDYVPRMIEVLRRSPVLHVGNGKTVTLKNVRPPAKTLSLSAEALCELSVVSGQLSGEARGPGVSGSGGVAEGHGAGDAGVSRDAGVSHRGAVRSDQPDAPGRGVGAEQHRRGARPAESGGVPPVSGPGAGQPDRTGDSGGDRAQSGVPGNGGRGGAAGAGKRGSANSERPAGESSLRTDNRQLKAVPVAILFGPENGAVSEKAVYEAAREAHAKSYAHLYVIGFAIQPNARKLIDDCEQAVGVPATYVQATPDLMMGDLLKNMRSSQIFSVCGLPEVRLRRLKPDELSAVSGQLSATDNRQLTTDNWYQVELLGLDVFDPGTMEVDHRPGSDVPCWMLDSDYNALCFKASQVFFPRTAAWDDLKRALKAEYAESVWDHLAGTTSAPFQIGENGQVAVKVIDDRGNELLVVKKASEAER